MSSAHSELDIVRLPQRRRGSLQATRETSFAPSSTTLEYACNQLTLAIDVAQGPLQVLGLAARNMFELDLRVRHVLMSESNLRTWFSEGVVDSLQVLEGVLGLAPDESHPSVPTLRSEQERVRDIARRHNLDVSVRPMGVAELAKQVGAENEYRAFFKLYSKLVHPTAYIVNGTAKAWDLTLRRVLLLQLQIYAAETLETVRSKFSVPANTGAQEHTFLVPADA